MKFCQNHWSLMSKLLKKPSAIPNINFLNFFFPTFVGYFCPPGSGSGLRIRIRIRTPNTDPDPPTRLNMDPIRIRNPARSTGSRHALMFTWCRTTGGTRVTSTTCWSWRRRRCGRGWWAPSSRWRSSSRKWARQIGGWSRYRSSLQSTICRDQARYQCCGSTLVSMRPRIQIRIGFNSVPDRYRSGSSIFCQCGSGYDSGSALTRVLMTRNWKNLQLEKFTFFWSKIKIFLSLDLHKGRQDTGEVLFPRKRTSSTSKLEFSLLLLVILALLDPNPYSQCGSGSSRPKWMRIRVRIRNTARYAFKCIHVFVKSQTPELKKKTKYVKNFGFSFYLCHIGIYEIVCVKFAPILTRKKI